MRQNGFFRQILKTTTLRLSNKTDDRLELLRKMERFAVCAEIGVWKGAFSRRIIEVTSPRKLHLIDPYSYQPQFPQRMYGGAVAKCQDDMDQICQDVRKTFEGYDRIMFHRGTSRQILPTFGDAYFDWVYIDGNHHYEHVLSDLRMCMSKVRPGGVIAGDDYNWNSHERYPVKRAVQRFVEVNSLKDNLEILGSQFVISL